jgi:hypothetical protein
MVFSTMKIFADAEAATYARKYWNTVAADFDSQIKAQG